MAEKGRMEKKCKELQEQFNKARQKYLTELVQYRDQKREAHWNTYMQDGMDELLPPAEEPMYQYCPETAMEEHEKQYFSEATQELVKLAMIKGAEAEKRKLRELGQTAGMDMQAMIEKLKKAEEARAKAQAELKALLEGGEGAGALMGKLKQEL